MTARSTTTASPLVRGSRGTAAFTLVELLVAATLSLVVMAALASLFGIFSRALNDGEQMSRLADRMRSTAWRLRLDLEGVTTEVKPFIRPEAACGYFELIEGPGVETGAAGDVDDILMLTTASPAQPFRGLISLTTATTTAVQTMGLESPFAEVAWFCKSGTTTAEGVQLYNLYRRQLLVAPTPGAGMLATSSTTVYHTGNAGPWGWDMYFWSNDVSVRREGDTLIANSLADLTRRHARFMHNVCGVMGTSPLSYAAVAGTVPHTVPFSWPQITTTSTIPGASDVLRGPREGQDLILANVIAFDIRVFDSQMPVTSTSGMGLGAYVDLGSNDEPPFLPDGSPNPRCTLFSADANVRTSGSGSILFSATGSQINSSLRLEPPSATTSGTTVIRMIPKQTSSMRGFYKFYDTWSIHTEWNNVSDILQTQGSILLNSRDVGSNLADSTLPGVSLNGVVDDANELEQPPPYSVPLRGVEVRIRCYEPSSQEVRQITIQHSFLAR